jgi:hypothetical protein
MNNEIGKDKQKTGMTVNPMVTDGDTTSSAGLSDAFNESNSTGKIKM